MVVHPGSDRVPRARPYSGTRPVRGSGCAYGAVTLCRRPSQAVRLPLRATAGPGRTRSPHPATPAGESTAVRARPPVWPWPPSARRYSGDLAVDFFSSGYLDVSVPRVVLPLPMGSGGGCRSYLRRVRPFGDPRVVGCVPLTADYRSLPRPSSASCAKASAVRPCYLRLVSHTCRGLAPPAIRCLLLPFIQLDVYLWLVAESNQLNRYPFESVPRIRIENRCRTRSDLVRTRYAALKVRGA